MANTATKRGLRGALTVMAIVGILVLLVAGVTLTNRPCWHTYTFPADPKTGAAVAIDYPDDWRIAPPPNANKTFTPVMSLPLKPVPPVGIVRWMQEKLLRQDINFEDSDGIRIDVSSGKDFKDMRAIEKEMQVLPPGLTLKLEHTRHALGAALSVDATFDTKLFGAAGADRIRGILIYPEATTGPNKIMIGIVGQSSKPRFPRIGATTDQIIPRIHLVPTGGSHRP
jgi:hypothetical protein